jgi:hypothetical protein
MNVSNMLKVFEYSILREGGVNVNYEQFGLKSDPYAALNQSSFSSFLNSAGFTTGTGSSSGTVTMPTAPTPPTDSTDAAAQSRYQQELVNYSQQLQTYNQNMMRLMLQQFQLMQQRMQSQLSASRSSSSSSSSTSSVLGTGGIIDV